MQDTERRVQILTVSVSFIAVVVAGFVLYAARDLLVPFAIALMLWYIINALTKLFGRLRLRGQHPPHWVAFAMALLALFAGGFVVAELVATNVNEVATAAPSYAGNVKRIVSIVFSWLHLPEPQSLSDMLGGADIAPYIGKLAAGLSNLAGDIGIVLVYVIFLLVAQSNWRLKLRALVPDPVRREQVREMIDRIQDEIEAYVWLKTVVSVLVGVVSYVVLAIVGVDFASFWALVIFLLNYIPTIGAVLGVIFPAILTLVQFGEPGPFLIVAVGLGAIHFVIGNVLEPKLQEARLGLDPVVLILALIGWGMMWGVAGMFLSVPLTVIAMIVLSRFAATRPLAILLSRDGELK